MAAPRKLLAAVACAVGIGLGTASSLSAPNDVIADYFVDGQINRVHSVDDLRAALAFAQERVGSGPQYTAFADIVGEAITRQLAGTSGAAEEQLGAQVPVEKVRTTPLPDPTATAPVDDGLPTPPPTEPGESLPMAVPVMGFIALGLVGVGSAAAVVRRRRRR